MHLSLHGNLSADSSLVSFTSPDLWPPISEVQWSNHSMKYVLTVSPRVHDLISPCTNSIAILKWLQIEGTDIIERQLTDDSTEVNLPRSNQTSRHLFRCVTFALGQLWGQVSAQQRYYLCICFGLQSRQIFNAICFCVLYWLHQSRLTFWCAHFSKSSQSHPHFLLSGALLFIGLGHHSR